jgi:ribonuclease VapC
MSETKVVLDASALLALGMHEPGADKVATVITGAAVPATNWAEMLEVIEHRRGGDATGFAITLKALGTQVVPVDEVDALKAARLAGTRHGLSLGDRFCLAVAERLGRPAYTADRSWAKVDTEAEVVLIR